MPDAQAIIDKAGQYGMAARDLVTQTRNAIRNGIEDQFNQMDQRVRSENPHPRTNSERAWDDMMSAKQSGADEATVERLRQKYRDTPTD